MKISKPNYPYKDAWDVKKNYMTFDLEGVDNTFANAIRRIILTDIKYISFKTRPYQESEINMITNDTNMDNQKLTHRIGLVPIHIDYPEQFDVNDYQFYIDKKNNGNSVIEVTSQDFKIKKLSHNKDLSIAETRAFFPPNPLTNDYISIGDLMPDKTGNGDKGGVLHFTAKASLKTPRNDAKYNIAQTSYVNKQNPTLVEEKWKEYYEKNKDSGTSKAVLEKRYRTIDAQRYFYTDEFGHANKFEFFIESYVSMRPMVILYKAVDILMNKLVTLNNNIKSGNYSEVDIFPSEIDMNSFDIVINHETYTLAALLQSYVYKLFGESGKDLVTYTGFKKEHPLKDTITLRIALKGEQNSKDNVIKVLDKTIEQLMKTLQAGSKQIAKHSDVSKYLKGEINKDNKDNDDDDDDNIDIE